MLILRKVFYSHPNRDLLFDNINLTVNRYDKIGLVGNNGSGKSTLLKLIAGELKVTGGSLTVEVQPYYIPQIFGQYNHLSVAQALGIDTKLQALKEILSGHGTEAAYALLDDDWAIEERTNAALENWQLAGLNLWQSMETLSGGQKTRVFLAGISIHQPELILMDEPSNHLDDAGRQLLYNYIQSAQSTLVIVSHDRKLLSLPGAICELSKHGITSYGGNYNFYAGQKQLENDALNEDLQNREKALRKAKEKERETAERQQKLDSRGRGKQEKAGVAKIMMNTLRNKAENSTAKLKNVHAEKINGISQELQELRASMPEFDQMKFGFDDSALHKGKVLFQAQNLNHHYGHHLLWKTNLDAEITSGERIAFKGGNGSGKTTLIQLILGRLEPAAGTVYRAENRSVYIDQDYSLLDNSVTVYQQAVTFNSQGLQEHEIKTRLNRFLFGQDDWGKPCYALSGGEKMRLILCCLTVSQQSPDLIVLDEPTNNLDIQNIEILAKAINVYSGTLIVVSHDELFLEEINIQRIIQL